MRPGGVTLTAEREWAPVQGQPPAIGTTIWLGLAVAFLLLFLIDLVLVDSGATTSGDRAFELWVFHRFGSGMFGAFDAISTAGSVAVRGTILVAIAGALHARRRRHAAAVLVGAVVGGELLNALVKTLVARPRPHLFSQAQSATGYAFPSGHAMSAIIFLGTLSYVTWRLTKRRDLTVVLVVGGGVVTGLIGLARIALGVHYPTDVLGGFELGASWLCLVVAVSSRWERRLRVARTDTR